MCSTIPKNQSCPESDPIVPFSITSASNPQGGGSLKPIPQAKLRLLPDVTFQRPGRAKRGLSRDDEVSGCGTRRCVAKRTPVPRVTPGGRQHRLVCEAESNIPKQQLRRRTNF
jgi:hypothetical protein